MTLEEALVEVNGLIFPAKQDGDVLWYPIQTDDQESYRFVCQSGEWEHQPE